MKVGDRVAWVTHAGGSRNAREGVIVEVVLSGDVPRTEIRPRGRPLGSPRRGVSYVVKSRKRMTPKSRTRDTDQFFWPLTAGLKLVEATEVRAAQVAPWF